jgi:hypothetical protein
VYGELKLVGAAATHEDPEGRTAERRVRGDGGILIVAIVGALTISTAGW